MRNIIAPVLISASVGAILYHYEALFERGNPVYFKTADQRIISIADQNYISSIFSIHNDSDEKINNASVMGILENENFRTFGKIISEKTGDVDVKYQNDGRRFIFTVPEIKSGDIINYEIVIIPQKPSTIDYRFFHDDSTIEDGTNLLLSYRLDTYLYFSAFAIIILSYILILISFYLKWTHSIFPGFFKSKSEAGFALLYSGSFEDAKSYINNLSERGIGLSIYDLANLAACYALLGDIERGRKYIEAAKINSFSKNLTIIKLSDFVIDYCDNKIDDGSKISEIKSLPSRYLTESPVLKKIHNNEWPKISEQKA